MYLVVHSVEVNAPGAARPWGQPPISPAMLARLYPRRSAASAIHQSATRPMLKLYSYFRSSAAYRVRIVLNLKGLSYEILPVHLTKDGGGQRRPEYRSINPQMRVPAL